MLHIICALLFIALSSLLGADGFVEIHGIVNPERGEKLKGTHFLVIDKKISSDLAWRCFDEQVKT